MTPAPKSILIVNIRLVGDVILTTPLIGLLHDAFPDAAIDLLVERGTGEFLEADPRVRRMLYRVRGKESGHLREVFRSYDLAINLNSADGGSLAALLAGKRRSIGFFDRSKPLKDLWKKVLLSRPLALPTETHTARICALVARELGIATERLEVRVFWSAADEGRVRSLLQRLPEGAPYLVVHPFARWVYKYWRGEHFARLSDAVARRYGLVPVWTSSPDPREAEELRAIAGLCEVAPLLIPGELNLNQMTCLLAGAALYLGLDTAISHLAASTGTPMVALYGPTFTKRWFPWDNVGEIGQSWNTPEKPGTGSCVVVQSSMACVPCGLAGCDNTGSSESPCLAALSVDEVLQAVFGMLERRPLPPRTKSMLLEGGRR